MFPPPSTDSDTDIRSAFDANNPDHLVALTSVLEGEDKTTDYYKVSRDESPDKKGAILDSLAHLAIRREAGQTISIGAVQVGKRLELVVAENGPVDPDVISFLVAFSTSLSNIRQRLASSIVKRSISALSEGSPPSLTLDSTPTDNQQLEKELHALKSIALLHNLPKLRARFLKHYSHFHAFYTHFKQNDRYHDDQRKAMSDMLNPLGELLRILGRALDCLLTNEDDAALQVVMDIIGSVSRYYVEDSTTLYHCTRYIQDTPSLQHKFHVMRWLGKVSSSHVHLVRVARLAASCYMTDFLALPPSIRPLDNKMVSSSFSVTRKAFVDLLKSIPWTAHENKGLDEDEIFDTMCANFKKTHPSSVNEKLAKRGMRIHCLDDEIQFDFKTAVHAECVVLEHLITRQTAMPLIGASKLSCTPCHLYYALRPSPFRTMGTHSLFPPSWTYPTNLEESRPELCKQLLSKLEERARCVEDKVLRERYEQTPEYALLEEKRRAASVRAQQWMLSNEQEQEHRQAG